MKTLVLSGGGILGPFQVGALKYLNELGQEYDALYGTSVGAINASGLSLHSTLSEGIAYIENLWLNVKNSDIKKHWPIPFALSYWKGGLYNPAPLQKFIDTNFDKTKYATSNKKLAVVATNILAGEAEIFYGDDPNITTAIVASSITPFFLAPVELNGALYLDGGLREVAPVDFAIQDGATQIDVISTEPLQKDPMEKTTKLPDLVMRIIGIMSNEIANNDISKAIATHPEVNIRVIRPKKELQGDILDFSRTRTEHLMEVGYITAKETVG